MNTSELRWACIVVAGDDATSFLDGQLSQSISATETGTWSCVLDPSSVVIASLWVRGGPSSYELLVAKDLCEIVVARLRRFLLRVRVTIEVTDAQNPPLTTLKELDDHQWPWVAEYARELTPHSFGASFVAKTVSFSKGCFTGQELVGRMDARGATMPWRFALVAGPTLDELERVVTSYGPVGPKGVTTVLDEGAVRAFAIVHRSALSTSANTSGVDIRAID